MTAAQHKCEIKLVHTQIAHVWTVDVTQFVCSMNVWSLHNVSTVNRWSSMNYNIKYELACCIVGWRKKCFKSQFVQSSHPCSKVNNSKYSKRITVTVGFVSLVLKHLLWWQIQTEWRKFDEKQTKNKARRDNLKFRRISHIYIFAEHRYKYTN